MNNIQDSYHRTFKTLRISLTNACNLGCLYCIHPDDTQKKIRKDITEDLLSMEQLVNIVGALKSVLPIDTIRLTGGEPTLYKELEILIKRLKEIGISNIKMTSNGYLLSGMAEKLARAGLKEVNISLDAINAEVFKVISRRTDLSRVLEGIESCLSNGIEVKINTVVLKGINDGEILPLLTYAIEKKIPIRFLELMKMGHVYSDASDRYFYSEKNILTDIATAFNFSKLDRKHGATANYWMIEEGYQFGIIANESSPFCQDCNRLRLDSYGNVYGCLSENIPVPVFDCIGNTGELSQRLRLALSHKQAVRFKGNKKTMISIGG
jgi:cyclic pyranopterin phosphate synthase